MKNVTGTCRSLGIALISMCATMGFAQESSTGLNLRTTLTGQFAASNVLTEAPRSGTPSVASFRGVLYPTWTISDHWFLAGAWQLTTQPFDYQAFSTSGYELDHDVLQASLNYVRTWHDGSILIRAGAMPTAFGLFPLHYDEADNPLVDQPIEYGYYESPVSIYAVNGAQVELTEHRWDGRFQFANSSPANPETLMGDDQHGNWAAGGGYTIRQGFRVGVSGFRGPYLERDYVWSTAYQLSGYAASGAGMEVNWARAHTNVQGEVQRFVMPSPIKRTIHKIAGYGELKQVLAPRWYVASRVGFLSSNNWSDATSYEAAAGYRPNRFQLVKFSFESEHYGYGSHRFANTFGIQLVTTLQKSMGRVAN